jgi:outer membrane protein TolC
MNKDSLINKGPVMDHKSRFASRVSRAAAVAMIAVAAVVNAQDSVALTMRQAVALACERNPKIRQYAERMAGKKWEERGAIGRFLPTLSVGAGFNAMNDPLTMDLDPIRKVMLSLQTSTMTKMAVDSFVRANGAGLTPAMVAAFQKRYGAGAAAALDAAVPHFIDTLKDKNYPSANISVVQPLFMGGKIVAAKKAASADRRGAGFEFDRTRNEVVQETFDNYCAVALLKQVVAVRREVVDGMAKHERDALGLTEAGMIARTNLLRARVAVAEARRSLDDDDNRLVLAKLALCKSIGFPETATVDISDTLARQTISGTCDDFLAAADSAQPILSYIRTRSDAAKAKVMAERSALLPRVAAFGKYELFPDYLSALEPHWIAGVTVNMDLFTGGKNIAGLASARHLAAETEAAQESARRDVRLWVRKAYIECCNDTARYAKLAFDESLARENLRQCRSRFENGYGTSLDVIDAELALEKNRIEKITALYDFHRSFMDLCTAAGESEKAAAIISTVKERVQ